MIDVADRLHAEEVRTDVHLVRRLLEEQFPDREDLPVERHVTTGSDHVLYRLGDELLARLPRKARVDDQIDKERAWLPWLALSRESTITSWHRPRTARRSPGLRSTATTS